MREYKGIQKEYEGIQNNIRGYTGIKMEHKGI